MGCGLIPLNIELQQDDCTVCCNHKIVYYKALDKIESINTNHLFKRMFLHSWPWLSLLARPRGWLFLYYDYPVHKNAHCVVVVSNSGAKDQHLTKLWAEFKFWHAKFDFLQEIRIKCFSKPIYITPMGIPHILNKKKNFNKSFPFNRIKNTLKIFSNR